MTRHNIEPTIKLTKDQIDFFHREGYLAIEAITTQEEIERLKIVYDRIFREQAGREEGNQLDLGGTDQEGQQAVLPQILYPSKYAPELRESLLRANALAIAIELLGNGINLEKEIDHAILKPSEVGSPTPWHQDEAYWKPELEYNSISIWVPFQKATVENGCLHFIPRTHTMEVVPHHSINNDPTIAGLEVDDDYVDTSLAVACPLPPGGATIHYSRTFHYAPGNTTNQPRRAYIIGFEIPPKQRATPRRFPWMEQKRDARQEREKIYQEKLKAAKD